MNVTYGIDVLAKNDPHIATAKIGMMSVAVASAPGAFLVDALPICERSVINFASPSDLLHSEIHSFLGPRCRFSEEGHRLEEIYRPHARCPLQVCERRHGECLGVHSQQNAHFPTGIYQCEIFIRFQCYPWNRSQ